MSIVHIFQHQLKRKQRMTYFSPKDLSKLIRTQQKFLSKPELPSTLDALIEFETKQIIYCNQVKALVYERQKLCPHGQEGASPWKEVFEDAEKLLAIQTQIMLRIKEKRRLFMLDGLKTKKDAEKLLAVLRQKLRVQAATATASTQDDLASFIARIELKLLELQRESRKGP